MGPIHPRGKIKVGRRLARACAATVYNKGGAFTGPTLTGCTKSGNSLTLTFNATLFNGDTFEVQRYNKSVAGASQMAVLVNQAGFCFQTGKFTNARSTSRFAGTPDRCHSLVSFFVRDHPWGSCATSH
jgi:hypothetical protein